MLKSFHEATIKQILLYWGKTSPSYFPSLPQIPLIFKVTTAKGFSGKITRDKNFSLLHTQVGGICLFFSSLLYYGKEHCSLKSSLPNNDSDLLNFLIKRDFYFSFLPTFVLTSDGRKFLSESEGRFDLEKNFTTGLLTRSHYFVCSKLTHFLSYSFFLLETIPPPFLSTRLISEWAMLVQVQVFFFFFWTILKVFIEYATMLLSLHVFIFGHKADGILASNPGLEPIPCFGR